MALSRPTDRHDWPSPGPVRSLLELFDDVREANGRRALQAVATAMHLSSASRVNDILRGRRPPTGARQVQDLVRALGGGRDEVERALRLHERASRGRGTGASSPLPISIPALPGTFVPRPALSDRILGLLGPGGPAVVALVGMGGSGKSVLASDVAVRAYERGLFPDGIWWVKVGRQCSPSRAQRRLVAATGAPRVHLDDDEVAGRLTLRRMLAQKRCLVVADDPWTVDQLTALLVTGDAGRVLTTTRDRSVARSADATVVGIDELTLDEARQVLARWVGVAPARLPARADALCVETGNLPLALAMIGARVRADGGGPEWGPPWQTVLDDLRALALDDIGASFADYDHATLLRAVTVSLDGLPDDAAARYCRLAVFDGRGAVPASATAALWSPDGTDLRAARALVRTFADRSLLRTTADGRVELHDLQYDVAARLLDRDHGGAPAAHARLLRGYRRRLATTRAGERASFAHLVSGTDTGVLDDGYLPDHLVEHLVAAGEVDEARALLTSLGWLRLGVRSRDPVSLLEDFSPVPDDGAVGLVHRAVQLSLHVLQDRPDELPGQLVGRLAGDPDAGVARLLHDADRWPGPWLRPACASLGRPGGVLRFTLVHPAPVRSVAVSDDDLAVSGCSNGSVRVWELTTARLRHELAHGTASVDATAVDPDGTRAVTVSADGVVRRWNLESGRCEHTVDVSPDEPVTDMALSASGRLAAVGTRLATSVWDVSSGRRIAVLDEPWSLLTTFADERTLLVGTMTGDLHAWDLVSQTLVRRFEGHRAQILTLATDAGTDLIATGSADRTARLWDRRDGRCLHVLDGHPGPVGVVAVDRAGSTVVTGDHEGGTAIWSATTGECRLRSAAHTDAVVSLAIDRTGRHCLSGSVDASSRLWDLARARHVRVLTAHTERVGPVAFTADGTRAVTCSWDRTLRTWDLRREDPGVPARAGDAPSSPTEQVTIAGGDVVAVLREGTARIHRVTEERPRLTLEADGFHIEGLVVAPGGIALARSRAGARLWPVLDGRPPLRLDTDDGHPQVTALAVVPKRGLAVTGYLDGRVRLWDRDGRPVDDVRDHRMWVSGLAVSGSLLLSASWDGSALLRDLGTGRVTVLDGHPTRVDHALFTPSGELVLTACADGTVSAYDRGAGTPRYRVAAHASHLSGIGILSGGRFATAGWDRAVRIWDTASGELLDEGGTAGRPDTMATDADDDAVVCGSEDGVVEVRLASRGAGLPITWSAQAAVTAVAVGRTPDGDRLVVAGDALGRVHQLLSRSG